MPWSDHTVLKSSLVLDTEMVDNRFNSLYNTIITSLFSGTYFALNPSRRPGPGAMDFTVTHITVAGPLVHEHPVFFLQIRLLRIFLCQTPVKRPKTKFDSGSSNLPPHLRIPKLYGISAFGRQLSYYTYDRVTGVLEPTIIMDSDVDAIVTAPPSLARCNTNIMEVEGRAKFLAMVDEIKQMVHALGYGSMYFVIHPSLTSSN
jgi:hypothetical protein